MPWIFEQGTGFLLSPTGQIVTKGYSGAPGYVDNPDDEAMQNKGPLPRGVYSIAAPQDTEAHGPYAMALSPAPGNEEFGRGGFMIHGDSIEKQGTASEGCVILSRAAREQIWNSGDHQLTVVA